MANRVTLSMSSSTFAPASRHASAMAVAVPAARKRNGAGVSLVEQTTTARAKPSGPRSFSRNSRSSRPRSPTRPMTTTSALAPRAIIESRVDLPTPEPANRPTRCPSPSGVKASMARTPVTKGSTMRRRRNGWGGRPADAEGRAISTGPSPSMGRPSASRTRPSSCGPTTGTRGRSHATTSAPACNPAISPSGIRSTRWPRNPTTSANSSRSPRAERSAQSSPKPTFGPSLSTMRPVTAVTRPTRRTAAAVRT